jgi:hypothetical protein
MSTARNTRAVAPRPICRPIFQRDEPIVSVVFSS